MSDKEKHLQEVQAKIDTFVKKVEEMPDLQDEWYELCGAVRSVFANAYSDNDEYSPPDLDLDKLESVAGKMGWSTSSLTC